MARHRLAGLVSQMYCAMLKGIIRCIVLMMPGLLGIRAIDAIPDESIYLRDGAETG